MKENPIKILFNMSRPILLLAGVGQYFLGVGISKYLGTSTNWKSFWIGFFWILSIQWVAQLLYDYFENTKKDDPKQFKREAKRALIGFGLALNGIIFVFLIQNGLLNIQIGILSFLIFFASFFYVIAPIRLINTGFAELVLAIIFANIIPSFGYLLQNQVMHRIVMIISLPLIFLIFSFLLSLGFENYSAKIINQQKTLISRLGWENAMFLHNTFVLLAFIILGLAGFFGLPSAIVIPAFLPLPLALLQLWHLRQISSGIKPNWRFLRFNGIAVLVLMTYIFTYIFWNR